jgi:DNA-binding MarR family transcriptional regulator
MKMDDQLRHYEQDYENNWQRLSFLLRRHHDIWAHQYIRPYWGGQMKLSYMPVIYNISVDGSTVMDISRNSMTVKQGISRTVKELEEHGMIVPKKNQQDKRSELLELSKKGKQFVLDARKDLEELQAAYKELVGEEELAIAVKVINKIIKYHESQYTGEESNMGE